MTVNPFTRKKSRKLHAAMSLMIAVLLFAAHSDCQIAGTGSIQGIIADQQGAVVRDASVTVLNTATGVEHKTTTGADGLYSLPNLAIGTYILDVSATGFKRYSQTGIILEVGSSIAVNVTLHVGTVTQEVEVQSDGLALQTEDASFKQTIDQQNITELPLNGRQMTDLITLSGAATTASASELTGNKEFYSSVGVSIAGGQGNMTNYRFDGADNNDYYTNVNLPFPFPDAVSEFSVESTALGAQDGLHPGGLVNVVTRSGSNQWHGSAFEFIRNNYIDADNFFSASNDTLHQNQFGGTFGGRIIRNKLFFFGGYQHLISNSSATDSIAYVPTPANLNGDFSVTDGSGCISTGKAAQLVNPQTGAVLPNNQISTAYFNSSALALEKYLPATTNPCGQVSYAVPNQQTENQIITRVDATLSDRNSIYGRYFIDGYTEPAFFSPTNVLITSETGAYERAQLFTFGETYTINSSTVNQFHVTGNRRALTSGPAPAAFNPSTIGINTYIATPTYFYLSAAKKFNVYCSDCSPGSYNEASFSLSDDVNMVRGKHQMVFGGEYLYNQLDIDTSASGNGVFTFSGVYSEHGPTGSGKLGTGEDANLDFLTGAMSAFSQDSPQYNTWRGLIPSLYAQDTYHATKRLVLTAGLRWEPEFMPVDKYNRGITFSMSSFLANQHSTVYPNAPAGVFFYGDKGVPRAFTQDSPWQFSPNLAVAFDPFGTGKTVVRAGVEMAYDQIPYATSQKVNRNSPFVSNVSNTPVGGPLSLSNPWSTGTVTSDPFPIPVHPTTSNATFPNDSSYAAYGPQAQLHPPLFTQWTASLQQEFGPRWQFQLDYIGNKSTSNTIGLTFNPAVFIPGNCGSAACSTVGNEASRFALTIANPTQGPRFAGGNTGALYITSAANANYNAMVVSIQHRLASNFSFMANYTWSHCIDIEDAKGPGYSTEVEDPNDINLDRANCGFDYRDMFNATLVAQTNLHVSGWKSEVINHWEIAPLVSIHDGTPFTVTAGEDNSLTDVGNDRPNLVSPETIYTQQAIRRTGNLNYMNASAFAQIPTSAYGTYGDVGRNSLRGPAYVEMDSEVSRLFPIRERFALDLRLEAFNLINHPNLGTPNSELSSSTFGEITSSGAARVFQGALKIAF